MKGEKGRPCSALYMDIFTVWHQASCVVVDTYIYSIDTEKFISISHIYYWAYMKIRRYDLQTSLTGLFKKN